MHIDDLSIENLDIPFKELFQHSSSSRVSTEAVLVRAKMKNNIEALGEGCPRDYVTGESLKTAHDFFNKYRSDFLKINVLNELKDWLGEHQAEVDKNPAAFCAVEIAILNVLANKNNQSVENLLSLPELSGKFHYTGVLGTKKKESFNMQLQKYLHLGFTDFKVKVFGEIDIDRSNVEAIKKCKSNEIRVRFDANNLWLDWEKAIHYMAMLNYPFICLEEPLYARQYCDCRRIYEELKKRIVLDESFTKQADFEYIENYPEAWVINIRISKMGGILRSLAVAEKSKELGIPIIIGAQVGETSILTRAALTVANNYRDILFAQEGAFGTYLLEYDIIDPPICFGKNGILEAEQI